MCCQTCAFNNLVLKVKYLEITRSITWQYVLMPCRRINSRCVNYALKRSLGEDFNPLLSGKCFHLMTSSWFRTIFRSYILIGFIWKIASHVRLHCQWIFYGIYCTLSLEVWNSVNNYVSLHDMKSGWLIIPDILDPTVNNNHLKYVKIDVVLDILCTLQRSRGQLRKGSMTLSYTLDRNMSCFVWKRRNHVTANTWSALFVFGEKGHLK